MIEFLKSYGPLILEALILIASTILFIVKKKPVKIVDSVKALIIGMLPEVINRVENYKDVFDPSRKLSGQEKFQMALNILKSYMVDELGIKEEDLPLYRDFLTYNIEAILSTPQKKEVIVSEDKTK